MMFFVSMIVTVRRALVIDDPWLTDALIWLVGVDVLELNKFVSEDVHGVTGEPVLEFLGGDVVMESLIVKTFPVVNNHVFVESFEESTSWKTSRFQTVFFGVPDPLLFSIWMFLSLKFGEIDIMDTSGSWGILICWISSDCHLVTISIGFRGENVEWESLTKSLQIWWIHQVMWVERAFLNSQLVFCWGGVL